MIRQRQRQRPNAQAQSPRSYESNKNDLNSSPHLHSPTPSSTTSNTFYDDTVVVVMEYESSYGIIAGAKSSTYYNAITPQHVRPRTPPMIPDKNYREYLQSAASSNTKFTNSATTTSTAATSSYSCSPHDANKACMYFSFIGALFLFWIHFLMERQPIFIKGIAPPIKNTVYTSADYKHSFIPASASALYAAWAYTFTWISCFLYNYQYQRQQRRRQHYRDIPDATTSITSTTSTISATNDNMTLPIFTPQPPPETTIWNTMLQTIQRTMLSTRQRRTSKKKKRGVLNKDM